MERPIFHRQAGQYGVTPKRSGRGAVDIDHIQPMSQPGEEIERTVDDPSSRNFLKSHHVRCSVFNCSRQCLWIQRALCIEAVVEIVGHPVSYTHLTLPT